MVTGKIENMGGRKRESQWHELEESRRISGRTHFHFDMPHKRVAYN